MVILKALPSVASMATSFSDSSFVYTEVLGKTLSLPCFIHLNHFLSYLQKAGGNMHVAQNWTGKWNAERWHTLCAGLPCRCNWLLKHYFSVLWKQLYANDIQHSKEAEKAATKPSRFYGAKQTYPQPKHLQAKGMPVFLFLAVEDGAFWVFWLGEKVALPVPVV